MAATTDEIRSRVEAADRARIQARADAAAQIAGDVDRRTAVLAELAQIQASLTARLDAAAAVMTLAELAEFTGIPESELRAAAGAGRPKKSVRRATKARTSRSARRAPAQSQAPVSALVAVPDAHPAGDVAGDVATGSDQHPGRDGK